MKKLLIIVLLLLVACEAFGQLKRKRPHLIIPDHPAEDTVEVEYLRLNDRDVDSLITAKSSKMTGSEILDSLGHTSSTTEYLRRDGNWGTPAGGGDMLEADSTVKHATPTQVKTIAHDTAGTLRGEMKTTAGDTATTLRGQFIAKHDTTASTDPATQSDLSLGLAAKKDAADSTGVTSYVTRYQFLSGIEALCPIQTLLDSLSDHRSSINLKLNIADALPVTVTAGYVAMFNSAGTYLIASPISVDGDNNVNIGSAFIDPNNAATGRWYQCTGSNGAGSWADLTMSFSELTGNPRANTTLNSFMDSTMRQVQVLSGTGMVESFSDGILKLYGINTDLFLIGDNKLTMNKAGVWSFLGISDSLNDVRGSSSLIGRHVYCSNQQDTSAIYVDYPYTIGAVNENTRIDSLIGVAEGTGSPACSVKAKLQYNDGSSWTDVNTTAYSFTSVTTGTVMSDANLVNDSLQAGRRLRVLITEAQNKGFRSISWFAWGTIIENYLPGSAPSAPSNLVASATTCRDVHLTWDTVENETGYTIQRSVDGTNYSNIDLVDAGINYYDDNLRSPYLLYYYRLCAENAYGSSAYSTADTARMKDTVYTPTWNPVNGATAVSSSQIDLLFSVSASVNTPDSIRLLIRPAGSGTYNWFASVGGSATTYSATGLSASTEYSFKMLAIDAVWGVSDSSQEAVETTEASGAIPTRDTCYATTAKGRSLTFAWAHVIANNSDRILMTDVCYADSVSKADHQSLYIDSVVVVYPTRHTMTLLDSSRTRSTNLGIVGARYYLINPPTGTDSIRVYMNAAHMATYNEYWDTRGASESWYGVHQTTPFTDTSKSYQNSATTLTMTLESTETEMVSEGVYIYGSSTGKTFTALDGQIVGVEAKGGTTSIITGWEQGIESVEHRWSASSNTAWTIIGVSLQAP